MRQLTKTGRMVRNALRLGLVVGVLTVGLAAAAPSDAATTWPPTPTCKTSSYGKTGVAVCTGKARGQLHRAVVYCQPYWYGIWPVPVRGQWTAGPVAKASCPFGLVTKVGYELKYPGW